MRYFLFACGKGFIWLAPLLCSTAVAATHLFIAPDGSKGVLVLQTSWPGQVDEKDAQLFYESMNVPVVVQQGADNKGIKTKDGVLLFACNTRHQQNAYTCTLGIKASDHSELSLSAGSIDFYTRSAVEAAELFKEFTPNASDGSFKWLSGDGHLSIVATPSEFHFKYH